MSNTIKETIKDINQRIKDIKTVLYFMVGKSSETHLLLLLQSDEVIVKTVVNILLYDPEYYQQYGNAKTHAFQCLKDRWKELARVLKNLEIANGQKQT